MGHKNAGAMHTLVQVFCLTALQFFPYHRAFILKDTVSHFSCLNDMIYRKSLAVSLLLMLTLVTGNMHQSYASHIKQHTHHHSSATHSTGACFLMCAAAHTIASEPPIPSGGFELIALIENMFPDSPSLIVSSFLSARAPPQ